MRTSFPFHNDPGHGWLEVTMADLKDVGLSDLSFSRYSYRQTMPPSKPNLYYLEEDCDAPLFIMAYEAKYGFKPMLEDRYTERTFIRNLRSILD